MSQEIQVDEELIARLNAMGNETIVSDGRVQVEWIIMLYSQGNQLSVHSSGTAARIGDIEQQIPKNKLAFIYVANHYRHYLVTWTPKDIANTQYFLIRRALIFRFTLERHLTRVDTHQVEDNKFTMLYNMSRAFPVRRASCMNHEGAKTLIHQFQPTHKKERMLRKGSDTLRNAERETEKPQSIQFMQGGPMKSEIHRDFELTDLLDLPESVSTERSPVSPTSTVTSSNPNPMVNSSGYSPNSDFFPSKLSVTLRSESPVSERFSVATPSHASPIIQTRYNKLYSNVVKQMKTFDENCQPNYHEPEWYIFYFSTSHFVKLYNRTEKDLSNFERYIDEFILDIDEKKEDLNVTKRHEQPAVLEHGSSEADKFPPDSLLNHSIENGADSSEEDDDLTDILLVLEDMVQSMTEKKRPRRQRSAYMDMPEKDLREVIQIMKDELAQNVQDDLKILDDTEFIGKEICSVRLSFAIWAYQEKYDKWETQYPAQYTAEGLSDIFMPRTPSHDTLGLFHHSVDSANAFIHSIPSLKYSMSLCSDA